MSKRDEKIGLVAYAKPGESDGRAKARTVLRPAVGAACAVRVIEPDLAKEIPIQDLVDELSEQVKAAQEGNLGRAEALLTAQTHTLDLLFNRLTRRPMGCDTVEPFEANMRMALRAQSQCARTLEVLAALKNPPVVIARQANISTGPQRTTSACPRAWKRKSNNPNCQGPLMSYVRTPEHRALRAALNSSLEAVRDVDRAKVARG